MARDELDSDEPHWADENFSLDTEQDVPGRE
jgi:hypothetical protein